MSKLSLFFLGPSKIVLDGRSLTLRTNKVQALLCYLAVEAIDNPGIAMRREALMELLWPDYPLKSAQDNLRQTLYQLRKAIPETAAFDAPEPQPFVLSERLTIQINPAAIYRLDAAEFQTLAAPQATYADLEQAAALYRGDFLADFYLPDSSAFEDWAAVWRLDLRGQALDALDKLTVHFTKQGKFSKAESFARRQLELDNLRESAYRQLMTALAQDGRRHEALQQYELYRQLLQEELGVEPSDETVALLERLRAGKRAPHPAPPPAQPVSRRHNLPAQTTSFVGRQKELADILRLLSDPTCRLLTLLGPGGIGKTRLSLQIAAALAQSESEIFPDGVFVAPLAAVPTMDYLVPTIAEAIGFSFSGPREPRQQLLTYLKSKKILLVLDNLEHLVHEAAPLSDFLTAVPGLTILTTSRSRLNLYEEWRFELKGLEVPAEEETAVSPPDLANYSAVQLFIQRARQAGLEVDPETELPVIGQICQLLAGMPLGIELAAGWVRTHTCQQIAAEIERNLTFLTTTIQNVPVRHRSLQVAFEHSWRLLPAEAQQIFARSTVFRGGFDREAASAVTAASPIALAGLADNSMLQAVGGRFQMNELLRQFGAEKLAESDTTEVQERHAAYYANFLKEREPHRWTAAEPATLNEISVELKNILSGWHWIIDHLNLGASMALIGRYATMLAYFYDQRGRYHEGVRLFQEGAAAVAAASASKALPNALAKTQMAEASLRFHLSQFNDVERLIKESLTTFRQNNDQRETAAALVLLGMTYNRLGAFDDANELLKESLGLFQQIGERISISEALNGLGIVAVSQERFEEAQQILRKSLAIYKETGYQRGIARALSNLGTSNVRSGNYDLAMPLYVEALAAARTVKDGMVVAAVLSNMGSISRILGDYENGLHYYEESLVKFHEMGERRWIAVNLNGLGETLVDMGQHEEAKQRLYEALEISTAIQSAPDILDSLAALGEIAAETGRSEQAIMTLSFVQRHPVTKPLARARCERALSQLRPTVSADLWERAQKRGESETLETFPLLSS